MNYGALVLRELGRGESLSIASADGEVRHLRYVRVIGPKIYRYMSTVAVTWMEPMTVTRVCPQRVSKLRSI
jgi:hypothetical protein